MKVKEVLSTGFVEKIPCVPQILLIFSATMAMIVAGTWPLDLSRNTTRSLQIEDSSSS